VCGIIGYVGHRPCRDILFRGLRRLEYRGYDSAGISVVREGRFDLLHAVGNLDRLEAILDRIADGPTAGMAHTRWATHGVPSEANAHPHTDCTGAFAIVVNGIVENYLSLRAELRAQGHDFSSDTDAEVVAHLIERAYAGSLREAVARIYGEIEGHLTICAMAVAEPEVLVAVRKETPLVVGRGEGESFVASAVIAFMSETREAAYPENGQVVELTRDGVHLYDLGGAELEPAWTHVDFDEDAAEKGGYETFMLKEIHEQSQALADTLAERISEDGQVMVDGVSLEPEDFRRLQQVLIVACGTSYHAGLFAKYALERWARLPVDIDVASEFRYRDPVVNQGTLCIGITQSGETADTLAAMRLARSAGAYVVAITNILGSQATRDADGVLFTRAGLEIGVAATKTLLAQFLAMVLFALHAGRARGFMEESEVREVVDELRSLPRLLTDYLEGGAESEIARVAADNAAHRFFLYLGRNVGLPVCLEGALKLKEISYIPTEAYAAGEMKHGPIALLEKGSPVVVVATDGHTYDKLVSNIQEVKARGAKVIAVATEGNQGIGEMADEVFFVPRTSEMLSPLMAVVPLQLFAYHVARHNGEAVDQPRNLAKTVTVE